MCEILISVYIFLIVQRVTTFKEHGAGHWSVVQVGSDIDLLCVVHRDWHVHCISVELSLVAPGGACFRGWKVNIM